MGNAAHAFMQTGAKFPCPKLEAKKKKKESHYRNINVYPIQKKKTVSMNVYFDSFLCLLNSSINLKCSVFLIFL